jgi:hypothetical protein
MTEHFYGEGPEVIRDISLPEWQEFMHYLYLPVRIPGRDWGNDNVMAYALPKRLKFLEEAISAAYLDAIRSHEHLKNPYMYVTARRGFATPGNPLNRPGWHCDDFGGTDLNYIWMDNYPTRVLRSDKPLWIPEDDAESMEQMEWLAAQISIAPHYRAPDYWQRKLDEAIVRIEKMPTNTLLKLSPYVIHAAPEIIEPGIRSFFKISISSHRYDLVGNSHNHELNYDWPMYDRQALRNQPGAFQDKDYSGVV